MQWVLLLWIGELSGHLKYKAFSTCKFSDLVVLGAYTQYVTCFLSKQARTELWANRGHMRPPWSLTVRVHRAHMNFFHDDKWRFGIYMKYSIRVSNFGKHVFGYPNKACLTLHPKRLYYNWRTVARIEDVPGYHTQTCKCTNMYMHKGVWQFFIFHHTNSP